MCPSPDAADSVVGMEESVAEDVVARLRAQSLFAHVNRRVGVYNVGVRLVIPDGREVIWDNDGAAGLEALVLRDGDLVGFVPQLPGSDDLDAAQIAAIIAATDYDAPMSASDPAHPTSAPRSTAAESAAAAPTAPNESTAPPAPAAPTTGDSARPGRTRWLDRLRGNRH